MQICNNYYISLIALLYKEWLALIYCYEKSRTQILLIILYVYYTPNCYCSDRCEAVLCCWWMMCRRLGATHCLRSERWVGRQGTCPGACPRWRACRPRRRSSAGEAGSGACQHSSATPARRCCNVNIVITAERHPLSSAVMWTLSSQLSDTRSAVL